MTTIMEETDVCPLTSNTDLCPSCVDTSEVLECKTKHNDIQSVKVANLTLNSSKNDKLLINESHEKKDSVATSMNEVECTPMVAPVPNRGRSRRGAVVKDSDTAILLDTDHVQNRSRRGAVVTDSDSDAAILLDTERVQNRSRRGAVVTDSDSDAAILLDTERVQNRSRRGAVVKDSDSAAAILLDTERVQYRGRSRRGAVFKESKVDDNQSNNNNGDSESAILLNTEHVQNSDEQKTTDLAAVEQRRGSSSTRSKSYPNSDLCSSMPDLRPHLALYRTVSVDSVALKEWAESTHSDADNQTSSLSELPQQPLSVEDDIKSHRRNSSLPIYVQRIFPELMTPASRPKSPLVLHELRSTVEPGVGRQSGVQSLGEDGDELLLNTSVDSATFKK